jgi:hypothetical protein
MRSDYRSSKFYLAPMKLARRNVGNLAPTMLTNTQGAKGSSMQQPSRPHRMEQKHYRWVTNFSGDNRLAPPYHSTINSLLVASRWMSREGFNRSAVKATTSSLQSADTEIHSTLAAARISGRNIYLDCKSFISSSLLCLCRSSRAEWPAIGLHPKKPPIDSSNTSVW